MPGRRDLQAWRNEDSGGFTLTENATIFACLPGAFNPPVFGVIVGSDADETSEVIKSPVRFDRDSGVPIEYDVTSKRSPYASICRRGFDSGGGCSGSRCLLLS